jgi:hypothetical protein
MKGQDWGVPLVRRNLKGLNLHPRGCEGTVVRCSGRTSGGVARVGEMFVNDPASAHLCQELSKGGVAGHR